jgi:hypothetical protein
VAGFDMLFDFNAIAKTMPVVTAVVCFLSKQKKNGLLNPAEESWHF